MEATTNARLHCLRVLYSSGSTPGKDPTESKRAWVLALSDRIRVALPVDAGQIRHTVAILSQFLELQDLSHRRLDCAEQRVGLVSLPIAPISDPQRQKAAMPAHHTDRRVACMHLFMLNGQQVTVDSSLQQESA